MTTKTLQFIYDAVDSDTEDCIVWPFSLHTKGYGQVYFQGRNYSAHRLALMFYDGISSTTLQALHGDCHNPACINPRHLYWGDSYRNQQDRVRDGTSNRGENSAEAKLTADDVRAIRKDNRTHRIIAIDYGVSRQTIGDIKTGKSWSSFEPESIPQKLKGTAKHIHRAALTEDDVKYIRQDARSIAQIAEDYNVSKQTITRIKNRTTWKHVE